MTGEYKLYKNIFYKYIFVNILFLRAQFIEPACNN